jgi:hypothetical protein
VDWGRGRDPGEAVRKQKTDRQDAQLHPGNYNSRILVMINGHSQLGVQI